MPSVPVKLGTHVKIVFFSIFNYSFSGLTHEEHLRSQCECNNDCLVYLKRIALSREKVG